MSFLLLAAGLGLAMFWDDEFLAPIGLIALLLYMST